MLDVWLLAVIPSQFSSPPPFSFVFVGLFVVVGDMLCRVTNLILKNINGILKNHFYVYVYAMVHSARPVHVGN